MKEIKKKKLDEVEKSYDSWIESFGDSGVSLIEHKRGTLMMNYKSEEFIIEYPSTYPKGKLVFITSSSKLESWMDNVNSEIDGDITLEEALTYAVSLREESNEASDDFGAYDEYDDVGDQTDFGDAGDNFGFQEDIAITDDEIEIMRLKKKMERERKDCKR